MIFRRSHFGAEPNETSDCPPANAEIGLGPSALVQTTEGPVPVEWLNSAHSLITRDHGPQPILHLWRSPPNDRPMVRIFAQAFGEMPDHDLLVAPRQPILLRGPALELHFGLSELLCTARHLVFAGLAQMDQGAICHHMLMRRQELICVNGVWSTSCRFDADRTEEDSFTLPTSLWGVLDLAGHHQLSVRPWLASWETALALKLCDRSAQKPRQAVEAA